MIMDTFAKEEKALKKKKKDIFVMDSKNKHWICYSRLIHAIYQCKFNIKCGYLMQVMPRSINCQ